MADVSNLVDFFSWAMEKFHSKLTKEEKTVFRLTRQEDVVLAIHDIQVTLWSEKTLRAFAFLKPYLEAITEMGALVEAWSNLSDLVAVIWESLIMDL
jgi:hypothetical protein